MRPEQAIEVLKTVTAELKLSLKEHQTVLLAIQTLSQGIKKEEEKPQSKK
jgi:hypothetical protein